MTMLRKIVFTGSALLLSAGVALAQEGGSREMDGPHRWGPARGGHDGMQGGMHHLQMRRHRMHDPVARLLDHQTYLRLTPTQVNSIISIDDKLHADNKPLMERLMAMHGERRPGGTEATHTPPSAAQRDSAMTIMRSIHENVWRATASADAVLTAEQLNLAGSLDHAGRAGRHSGMSPGGPERGGRDGGSRG